jgi:hypothetical protein
VAALALAHSKSGGVEEHIQVQSTSSLAAKEIARSHLISHATMNNPLLPNPITMISSPPPKMEGLQLIQLRSGMASLPLLARTKSVSTTGVAYRSTPGRRPSNLETHHEKMLSRLPTRPTMDSTWAERP